METLNKVETGTGTGTHTHTHTHMSKPVNWPHSDRELGKEEVGRSEQTHAGGCGSPEADVWVRHVTFAPVHACAHTHAELDLRTDSPLCSSADVGQWF